MARHVEAWMDGTRLSDIGPIIIQDVNELPPDMEITYGVRAIRSGQNIQKYRRKSLRLTIEAAVRELFDLGKRTAVQQAMAGWASGSILELSSHPGQQLHVICKNVPTLGKIRDYKHSEHRTGSGYHSLLGRKDGKRGYRYRLQRLGNAADSRDGERNPG